MDFGKNIFLIFGREDRYEFVQAITFDCTEYQETQNMLNCYDLSFASFLKKSDLIYFKSIQKNNILK